MGGGAAMRAAAKGVVGIGAITTGIRSTATGSIEHPVNVAVRPALSGLSAPGLTVEQPDHKSAWEIDDWEFAGVCCDDDAGFVVDRFHNPGKPRLVFGPVPTFEETKEATIELKDALDKVYLSSPKSAGSVESAFQETKACITHESSVPKSAMQAFRLLKESSAAQTVVASIACDPNVWNAVMENPALVEYLETEKKSKISESPESEDQDKEAAVSSVESSTDDHEKPDGLMALFETVKLTVVDMVQNLASMIQNWFSFSETDKTAKSTDNGTRSFLAGGSLAGGSLMALAMMVVMVVAVRRA